MLDKQAQQQTVGMQNRHPGGRWACNGGGGNAGPAAEPRDLRSGKKKRNVGWKGRTRGLHVIYTDDMPVCKE